MKTELHAKPHAVLPGVVTVELWHDGQFIGTVVSTDEPRHHEACNQSEAGDGR